MCGIVALFAKTSLMGMDVTCFEELLLFDSVRGIDGTGAIAVRKTGNADICKIGSHAYDFIGSEAWKKLRNRGPDKYNALLGHNRKATLGSVCNENAHPFRHEGIVVVHNGFVEGYKDFNSDAVVDSSVLPKLFYDYKDNLSEAFLQLKGAFSLLWYNAHNKMIYWVHNKERPLYIGETEQIVGLASEPWMLAVAGARSGNKWKEIKEVPTDVLFSWHVESKSFKEPVPIQWKQNVKKDFHYPTLYDDFAYEMNDSQFDSNDIDDGDKFNEEDTKKEVTETKELGPLSLRAGDTITFSPQRLLSWTRDMNSKQERRGWRIEGVFGDTIKHRVHFSMTGADKEQQMQDLYKATHLTGKIYSAVSDPDPRYGKYIYWVESVEVAQEKKSYRTLNGTILTLQELVSIKNKHRCQSCKEPVKIAHWNRISVKKDSAARIVRVFCEDCVNKRIETLPEETKAKILQQNLGV
jgi:hypothetical protein